MVRAFRTALTTIKSSLDLRFGRFLGCPVLGPLSLPTVAGDGRFAAKIILRGRTCRFKYAKWEG